MKAILEIEMPEKCGECQLSLRESSSSRPWCVITTENCEQPYKRKNNNCPLIAKESEK